jgi:regulator of cell morphogenesis and NO signaling
MRIHPNETIGGIVAADYRAAAVFERFGLDFCCGGKQTLNEVCQQPAVDAGALLHALDELPGEGASADAAAAWPLDTLIEHILARHHAYVRSAIPILTTHTAKIAAVHGERSPELLSVARQFAAVAEGLTLHMAKEEQILFPYIRSLVEADRAGQRIAPSPFGTVHNPIRMMEAEHEEAGDDMRAIRELTQGYALPAFACATYRACFEELQEFEWDLHRHVHLENNVLFPRAIRLEEGLS